ncbi:glutamate ABC transporter substrate-binding protein [Corynebacterium tapiri]|uniref:Glutamate ABC transporter substrate-binding protein n=1 Tax=Corynebacterium tapiri TaxID=1448266 RepID=A0A5C4U324_9CORY|nr:glutamate ABC transporter substrate-binding protein [Corynebacterium tapiri]TNL95747.1 glutamate ABC transporter substrate-binding protein [Corynebacterium tapiri]
MRLLPLVLLAACGLSACSSAADSSHEAPAANPAYAQPREVSGMPLPAGSQIEHAGQEEPRDTENGTPTGTLRPDNRLTKERVPRIVARGRLIVGVDQSQNRLSFRDPLTGEYTGFEVELAKEIARDIFGDPNAIEFRFIASADRADALNSREVDIIVRTMSITQERERDIDYSAPYVSAATRILTSRGSDIEDFADLDGRTACAAIGSTSVDKIRSLAPGADILKVSRWSDCLMALQQRQVDAVVTDDLILAGMADQDPFTTIVGEPIGREDYGVGVRKSIPSDDSSGLVRQVNETLERIRTDGTWQRLYHAWFGPQFVYTDQPQPLYREEAN